ncbi:MAG: 4Fe-4S dicluster domain-containing protein [Eggerthellaceae bacterium]|nr:4Fe-4S dicluster domain-containing protein [Eggerthellaceae bacterium]
MGVFKLGKMTFGSLFKKPETVLYPLQTKPQPAGLKGHIDLDAQACILCGMCERSCATNCIKVDKAERYWEIDRFQCVQCGYCITVCPKKCLSMDPNYAPASTERKADRVDVPDQGKPDEKPVADKEKAPAPAGAPAPAEPQAKAASEKSVDAVLEGKIALMDPEKAERVRAALSNR